jgi:hypothetical protein
MFFFQDALRDTVGRLCVLPGGELVTQPNPQPLVHLGVKLQPWLAAQLKSTAAQRGTTASNIVRAALAKALAELPEKPSKAA